MTDKQTIVVKLGGSLLDTLPEALIAECKALQTSGAQVVIVHGGGARINDYMKRLGLEARFVNGLRVTDAQVLELVEMVLGGSANKRLVSRLEQAGGRAIGISGIDRGLLTVRQQDPALGFVGAIERVNTDVLRGLCSQGWMPVIASLGVGADGQHYNINADTAAGAVAAALGADQLVFVTDVPGIMTEDGEPPLRQLTPRRTETLMAEGTIHGGMIPKVQAALDSVKNGVKTVCIGNGHAHGVLAPVAGKRTEAYPGTVIVAEEGVTDGVDEHIYALADRSG